MLKALNCFCPAKSALVDAPHAAAPPRPLSASKAQDRARYTGDITPVPLANLQQLASDYREKHKIALYLNGVGPGLSAARRDWLARNRGLASVPSVADAAHDLTTHMLPEAMARGRAIGYLWGGRVETADERSPATGAGHLDSFIALPSGRIISPNAYESMPSFGAMRTLLRQRHGVDLVSNGLVHIIHRCDRPTPPHPQSSFRGCSSLGISYLKEYLKQGGEQLRDYSLVIDNISLPADAPARSPSSFFLSSPQVLRYSQSGTYNSIVKAMVHSDRATETIVDDRGRYEVPTLSGMVKAGATLSRADGTRLSESDLKQFRRRWMDAFASVDRTRTAMNTAVAGKGPEPVQMNAYFGHLADRHARRNIQAAGPGPDL